MQQISGAINRNCHCIVTWLPWIGSFLLFSKVTTWGQQSSKAYLPSTVPEVKVNLGKLNEGCDDNWTDGREVKVILELWIAS